MEAQYMLEHSSEGTFLKLSKTGRKLPLIAGQRTKLMNVAGARNVEIAYENDQVRVRARVPESSGPLTCTIGLRPDNALNHGSLGVVEARSLEEWIFDARVASNGRW